MSVALTHFKYRGSVTGDRGKSFNPQWHWPVYPLAPDRPHLEYKSAWANLLGCLKTATWSSNISLFPLKKTHYSPTLKICPALVTLVVWLIYVCVFLNVSESMQFPTRGSGIFSPPLTPVCWRDKLFEIIFLFISCFLWFVKRCCATSATSRVAGSHTSGSHKHISSPILLFKCPITLNFIS